MSENTTDPLDTDPTDAQLSDVQAEAERVEATQLSDGTSEPDDLDSDLDGGEDAEDLEGMAGEDGGTDPGTVATESTQDLINDGADLALSLDDEARSEKRAAGVVPLDQEMVFDDETTDETIEDRIQQEEPDPASDIVPPDAGRRA